MAAAAGGSGTGGGGGAARGVESVWDAHGRKALVYCVDGRNLRRPTGARPTSAGGPQVRIVYGGAELARFSARMPDNNNNSNSGSSGGGGGTAEGACVFAEFAFVKPRGFELGVEVWDDAQSTSAWAAASLGCLEDYAPDAVVDLWQPLQPLQQEPQTDSDEAPALHLRLFVTELRETRAQPESVSGRPTPGDWGDGRSYAFVYEPVLPLLDTGDLLAFSGGGLLATAVRLKNNSEISGVGVVLRSAAKRSGLSELCVFEVTRNCDGLADAWAERRKSGACVFRLDERLHALGGYAVFACRLRRALSGEQRSALEAHVRRVHAASAPFPKRLTGNIVEFVASRFGFGEPDRLVDLYGAYSVREAYRAAGVPVGDEGSAAEPFAIAMSEAFEAPIALRLFVAAERQPQQTPTSSQ